MTQPKLSPTQKKVVAALREGNLMYKKAASVMIMNGYFPYTVATYFSLVKKGIIETYGEFVRGTGVKCRLTKLGQEISID